MNNKIITYILLLASITYGWAQQDAQYTQYMYNMSVINPAYTTGNMGVLNMGALHRTQWVGVDGAPKSSNLFAHTPINNKIELGFSLVHDNIGDAVKDTDLSLDFAYKLNLEENGTLSFGLKTGVSFFDVNFTGFNLESGEVFTDPDFAENINESFFNLGAGIYYNTNNYYVGISVPNFLNGKYLERNSGKYQGTEVSHIYFTGGYVFELNNMFKIKPAFMGKTAEGAPFMLDLTANVLYNNKIEFGVGYRIDESFSGLVNFRVKPELRIGYAYDHTLSNLGPFSSGSHEVFILYDLDIFNKNPGHNKSPRFF